MQPDPVLDIFREEAREHLGALEKLFLDLEAASTMERRRELINNLFRHAHSLKSDAKVVGLLSLKEAAQLLEDILDELREKPDNVNRQAIDRSLAQFDKVRTAFEAWHGAAVSPAPTASAPVQCAAKVPIEPAGAPTVSATTTSAAAGVSTPAAGPATATASAPPPPEESFTVRVSAERLDRMLSMAGELRISQRSAQDLASRLQVLRDYLDGFKKTIGQREPGEERRFVDAAHDQVRRIEGAWRKTRAREEMLLEALEADIREARLLPLIMLTDSLRRAVRDLAQSLGKSIRYETQVGRILLDKAVLEALKDPLVHLVRNAADHGIEAAAERRAAGKPEEGSIRIEASQQGQEVRITVSDDGRGVNFERVREHLRRTGQADEASVAQLTEPELAEVLFHPGFSTAPRGEVSGRGVGLDVVQDTLRRLHGSVRLEASSAAGTTFALMVPVTISTIRILTVMAAGLYYGIPSSAVIRTGRARHADLRELAGQLVLPLDGQPVRWLHLAELMGGQAPRKSDAAQAIGSGDGGQANAGPSWSYVMLASQGRPLAVAVDDLEDEIEVLLKPLGFPLENVSGVVGATIRANGAVQLVLDLADAVWAGASGTGKESRPAAASASQPAARRILVVDDSPTTRAILRNVFTAAGFAVTTAMDGMDALERLRLQMVDLVVSDVEMPRLNGFDLTRQIKSKFGLPVILVTGREKEEQRREGLAAGADAYIVKSTFEGTGLLEIVQQFV